MRVFGAEHRPQADGDRVGDRSRFSVVQKNTVKPAITRASSTKLLVGMLIVVTLAGYRYRARSCRRSRASSVLDDPHIAGIDDIGSPRDGGRRVRDDLPRGVAARHLDHSHQVAHLAPGVIPAG